MNLANDERLNHRLVVTGGVLAEPAALTHSFFRQKREFQRRDLTIGRILCRIYKWSFHQIYTKKQEKTRFDRCSSRRRDG